MAALLPLLLLIPLWLLLVRPQQRRVRAQQAMVRTLQPGDDVVTSAGIYGSIIDLDDQVVTLEVAEGVRLRIARMAIGSRLNAHADELVDLDERDDLDSRGAIPSGPSGDESDRPLPPPPVDEP